MSDPAPHIAAGRQPQPWAETFAHPVHGDLQFKATLPNALALAEHSVRMDNLLSSLSAEAAARPGTMVLIAALAGLTDGLLVELPVIDRNETSTDAGIRVEFVYYDPEQDPNVDFLTDVWVAFSIWRRSVLTPEVVSDVGKSSEPTTGPGSDTRSDEPGTSPSATPG